MAAPEAPSPPEAVARPVAAAGNSASFAGAALAIALLVLVGLAVLPRVRLASQDDGRGKAAPTFTLPVIHNGDAGARLALADLKGSPVLLDFWATWCGPCAMQTPILDRLARRHRDRGLRVVGIDVHDDDPDAARRYAGQKELSYPIVVDEKGLVQRAYGVSRLPSLVVIDKEGNIVHVTSGLVDEATLDRLLREVL